MKRTEKVSPAPANPGRYDQGKRRRSQRKGRETGCWVYIPAEELAKTGIAGDGPPYYRTFGRVNSVIVKLYKEA